MDPSKLIHADPRSLASLIDLDPSDARLWTSDELGSILRHLLTSPLRMQVPTPIDAEPGDAGARPEATLRDLLSDPSSPPEALIRLKDFARHHANHPASPLPAEVSRMVYVLAIAAARLRRGRRITSQSDAKFAEAVDWAMRRAWLEDGERAMLRSTLDVVRERPDNRSSRHVGA